MINLILYDKIDPLKHKAIVKQGILIVTLYKKGKFHPPWENLINEMVMKDKLKANEFRDEENKKDSLLKQELDVKRKERKIADERLSVKKQMAVDEYERLHLESLKAEEKERAEKQVYETFANIERQKYQNTQQLEKNPNLPRIEELELDNGELDDDDDLDILNEKPNQKALKDVNTFDVESETELKYVQPPRNSENCKVEISFSTRLFPTPLRESKISEEEDWIAKNRSHISKHGMLNKQSHNKDIDEDPFWLKSKGDDFFRNNDWKSAISAYTSALDVDSNMISCYSNRSLCYLKMNLLEECKADCLLACLKLTDSEQTITQSLLYVKFYLRQALVNCQLGDFKEAISNYQNLLTWLASNNANKDLKLPKDVTEESIRRDYEQLQLVEQGDTLKKLGDKSLMENNIDAAEDNYSNALLILPFHVGCLSNRAACKIAKGDFNECIQDCSSALDILQLDVSVLSKSTSTDFIISSILPSAGSDKRKVWITRTLARRGMAYCRLNKFTEAIQDYEESLKIDPTNTSLLKDIEYLKSMQ